MRILITAGPTREYLDDIRFLTNASSGRMGYALAQAALNAGHTPVLVSGPVALTPPQGCEFHPVETSAEMHDTCLALFPGCDGVIGTAAVCDYTPVRHVAGKMSKTGKNITIEFAETQDVLAALGRQKQHRWVVGFALEADNARANALRKLSSKSCDAIALNGPGAINSASNAIELIDASGLTVARITGSKEAVAKEMLTWIDAHLGRHEYRDRTTP